MRILIRGCWVKKKKTHLAHPDHTDVRLCAHSDSHPIPLESYNSYFVHFIPVWRQHLPRCRSSGPQRRGWERAAPGRWPPGPGTAADLHCEAHSCSSQTHTAGTYTEALHLKREEKFIPRCHCHWLYIVFPRMYEPAMNWRAKSGNACLMFHWMSCTPSRHTVNRKSQHTVHSC